MSGLEKVFDDIDEFFASKEENERYAYLFLPVLVFGFLFYQFVMPITAENIQLAEDKKADLSSKIKNVDGDLFKLRSDKIKIPNAIRKYQNDFKKLLNEKDKLEQLLTYLDIFSFDISTFGSIYNEIPNFAREYNLKIEKVSNNVFLDEKSKKDLISKNMTIDVNLNGNFMNVLRFMGKFENRKELIRVVGLKSDLNKSTINIEIFGANL